MTNSILLLLFIILTTLPLLSVQNDILSARPFAGWLQATGVFVIAMPSTERKEIMIALKEKTQGQADGYVWPRWKCQLSATAGVRV